MGKIWMVNAGVCLPEVEEEHEEGGADHYWYPALDRRAALRLLGMCSMAVVAGCGAGGAASTATSTAAAGTTATTTRLTASASTIAQNGSLTLTATVSPSAAIGTVTFYDGTTALGRVC